MAVSFIHGRWVHTRRVRVLRDHLLHLMPECSPERPITLLDIGSGDGRLAAMLAEARPGLTVRGVDVLVRSATAIPVDRYDGKRLPYEDGAFDGVMLIDVLHHTENPAALLAEARRVTRRFVLLKDHEQSNLADRAVLRFMDYIGNARFGVALPHQYLSQRAWDKAFAQAGLAPAACERDLHLYPPAADVVFGRGLHFVARLEPHASRQDDAPIGDAGQVCEDDAWEAAYARFETPEQEVAKFTRRLRRLGADGWSRQARIAELFCGRGNGLIALEQMGFSRLVGVDLSASLLAQYRGAAETMVADCRRLRLSDRSCDVVIIQGGLHHLPELPGDLEATLDEVRRVLAPAGKLVVVEPWLTPFLSLVHSACRVGVLRRASSKLDALATMIEHERRTYEQWLGMPDRVLRCFADRFELLSCRAAGGKLSLVGTPQTNAVTTFRRAA